MPTKMTLPPRILGTWRGHLILFVLAVWATALALRENSIAFDFEVIQGRLRLSVDGLSADFGPVPEGQSLLFYNIGPNEKRSPNYLIRATGLLSEVWFLLSHYRPDERAAQTPFTLSVSELQHGPVPFRFWNPFHPGLEVRIVNGPSLGYVRFHVHETIFEIHVTNQNASVHWSAPLVKLLLTGLSFSLLSGCTVFLLVSLVWSLTRRAAAEVPQEGSAPPPSRPGRAVRLIMDHQWVLAFVLGTLWIGYVHFWVFDDLYGFGDEMNYLVQARILTAGHVFLPQPEAVDFFKVNWMDLMVDDGKIWNFHPIGNSLLLAAGMLLGSAAIVPPLIGGGIFAALFALARRLVGSAAFAWLCVLVAGSSQYVATNAASFMAHAPALLFIELATLALVSFVQTRREGQVVLMGAFFGAAFLVRPLSAVLAAVIPAGVLLIALSRRKVRFRTLVLAAAVGLAIASVEFWRTYLTVGQFTLAYMAKGPEASMSLSARWARGWEWRLKTLYLNYKYYHNRVFGLGFVGNLLFFFVPLVVARKSWVRLSYIAILIYTVVHSFLHFYGWMWEPRMLFEFTHLTLLLTAYGMWLMITAPGLGVGRPNWASTPVALALAGAFLGFNFVYDLPERFSTEYFHYNKTDPYVRTQIREQGIRNALFFYKDATSGFAPHLAENEIGFGENGDIGFTGNVVHAIHLGNLKDYALISKYPDRRVFYSPNQQTLQEVPNFYRDALPKLVQLLSKYAATHELAVGIPWLTLSGPEALSAGQGIQFLDDDGFFSLFVDGKLSSRPYVVASVGGMKEYSTILRELFAKVEPIPSDDLGFPISIVEVDPASRRPLEDRLGLQMNVYRVAKDFKAAPYSPLQCLSVPAQSTRVGMVYFDGIRERNVCVDWSGEFTVTEPATYTFGIAADDGAGLVIDGKTVVDNGMFKSQGETRREGTVRLEKGRHTFYLNYVQVAGPALLDVEVRKDSEPFAPLNLASLGGVMRLRKPEEVTDKFGLLGLGSAVLGTSTAADNINATASEPIAEVIDPGPDHGSLLLRMEKPYSLKRYPYVQFYYKMAPNTAYSMMVRILGDGDFLTEIPMRIEQPRREGKTIGAFNALQDDQWHLMKFNLYKALGSRDVWLEEAILGEWAGASERRTIYFKDFCLGPWKAKIVARNLDNQVRMIGPAVDGGPETTSSGVCPFEAEDPEWHEPVVLASSSSPENEGSSVAASVPAGAKRRGEKAPKQSGKALPLTRGGAAQREPQSAQPVAPQLLDASALRVASSRQDAPWLAARAIDGNAQTRWDTGHPQAGGEWFRIDLKQPVLLTSISLDTIDSPDDYPKHLEVSVSADGGSFKQLAAVDGQGLTKIVLDAPAPACSIRLEQKGRDVAHYWSIHELQLWGSPQPGDCPAELPPAAGGTPTPTPAPIAGAPETEPQLPKVEPSELRVSAFRMGAPNSVEQAIDDLSSSRWDTGRPQAGKEWFRVDLPGVGELERIRLHVEGAPLDYPRILEVWVSTDGSHFEPATSVQGRAPDTVVDFHPPVRCSAVRLEQKGTDPVYFWAINDLTLWGNFPKRVHRWWEQIPYPGAWLALLAAVVASGGAVVAGRRRRRRPDVAAHAESASVTRRWRAAGVLTALLFAVILIATQRDYGETWDELESFQNGEQYYQYLFVTGKTPPLYGDVFKKYYAPFSDIVATTLKHLMHDRLGWMSEESAFHLHLNLLFVLGGLVLFRVILPEYGGRAAYACLLVYFASPHLLGHCHNNMKDFAVTAWTVMAVFSFHAAVRQRSYPGLALVGLLTGMTLASKINGVLLGPIFLVYVLLFLALSEQADESFGSRLRFAVFGCGVVHWTVAIGTMVLLWPWLWNAPYTRFMETVQFFQHHTWNGLVLYKGDFVRAALVPRDYAPYYVLITTPIAWLPFALVGLARAGVEIRRQRFLVALVSLGLIVPLIVEVFTSAPIYDGVRHFLAVFPFLACLVGFGMDWLLIVAQGSRTSRAVAVLLVAGAIGSAIFEDIRMHPYQSTYYNTLVGGGRGAMGRFELDYWGNSLKEAGRYVNANAPPGSKVHVILGLERLTRLRRDLVTTPVDPDYAIVLNRESLAPDPYKDRTPIYNVTADGAVLTKVYRLAPQ